MGYGVPAGFAGNQVADAADEYHEKGQKGHYCHRDMKVENALDLAQYRIGGGDHKDEVQVDQHQYGGEDKQAAGPAGENCRRPAEVGRVLLRRGQEGVTPRR